MSSIKDKLEIVGLVAVVLSLLILAYEIRQNTDTAAAQAVFELNDAARETLFQQATNPNLAALIKKAESDWESLSERERFMYNRWVFADLNLFESAWKYHRRGVISDEEMEGWIISFCGYVSRESYKRAFESIDVFSSGFRQDSSNWCD